MPKEQKSEILERKIRGVMFSLKIRKKRPSNSAKIVSWLFEKLKKEDEPKHDIMIHEYKELIEELKQ